jgi:hypothetical protein
MGRTLGLRALALQGGVLVVAAFLALMAASAPALALDEGDSTTWDAELKQLFERAFSEELTREEVGMLRERLPGLAHAIPDLAAAEVHVHTVASDTGGAGRQALNATVSSQCKTAYGSVTIPSTTGWTSFTFHHQIDFCYNGWSVTSFDSLSHGSWLTDTDWTIHYVGLTSDFVSGRGTSHAKAVRQAHVRSCFGGSIGCIASVYPRVELHMFGHGAVVATVDY